MRSNINLPFKRITKRESSLDRIADRPSIRALPRRRPRGLVVALLTAWAVLAGVA